MDDCIIYCFYNNNYLNNKNKILLYFMNNQNYDITQQNIYKYNNYNYMLIILFAILIIIYFIMIIKKAN